MVKIKSKKLVKKLYKIEGKLLLMVSLLEVVRDFCLQHDYTNQETILEMALKETYNTIEIISLMY